MTDTARRKLEFAGEDDAIAELSRLRQGWRPGCGSWTLGQIAWHLNKATMARMQPPPYPSITPEQEARRPIFEQALATGQLPKGIVAPDPFVPPAQCDESAAIDELIQTLTRFKNFRGPFSPHRLFGPLTEAQAHRINLIHCAHHLSHVLPADEG